MTEIARKEGDVTAGARRFEKGVINNRKFSLLGLNIGPTYGAGKTGSFTFSGRGQFFSPFGNGELPDALGTHAVRRKANICTIRAVTKASSISVWSTVGIGCRWACSPASNMSTSGNTSQAVFWARRPWRSDYLFSRGPHRRVRHQGSFAITPSSTAHSSASNSFTETYLKVVNQAGASGQFGLFGSTYLEGNFGYLESHAPGRAAGPVECSGWCIR